jgi:hypothetical protein
VNYIRDCRKTLKSSILRRSVTCKKLILLDAEITKPGHLDFFDKFYLDVESPMFRLDFTSVSQTWLCYWGQQASCLVKFWLLEFEIHSRHLDMDYDRESTDSRRYMKAK